MGPAREVLLAHAPWGAGLAVCLIEQHDVCTAWLLVGLVHTYSHCCFLLLHAVLCNSPNSHSTGKACIYAALVIVPHTSCRHPHHNMACQLIYSWLDYQRHTHMP